MLFDKYFLIYYPPEACCLHFREAIQPRRILYYTGGRRSRPPVPPWIFTTKNVENGAKQISKHSTGSQGGVSPLALTHSGETNMKKKVLIELELIKLVKSTYVSE